MLGRRRLQTAQRIDGHREEGQVGGDDRDRELTGAEPNDHHRRYRQDRHRLRCYNIRQQSPLHQRRVGKDRTKDETKNSSEYKAKNRLAEGVDAGIGKDAQEQQFSIAARWLKKGFRDHLQMRQVQVVEDFQIEQHQAPRLAEKAFIGEITGDGS